MAADVRPTLALGVLSSPTAVARRAGARASWMLDPSVRSGRVAVRFVLGGRATGKSSCAAAIEAARQQPDVLILDDALDCAIWHSPAKVHAWFRAAVRLFGKTTPWIGKAEDDTLPWPSALLTDLAALDGGVQQYGVMAWQGSCVHNAAGSDTSSAYECAGCYAGSLWQGASVCNPSTCRGSPSTSRCCQAGCPSAVRMVPFAIGALDVRRHGLARTVAECDYAAHYFDRLTQHGAERRELCSTTDGSQGHAIGECVKELRFADAGQSRLYAAASCESGSGRCANGHVMMLHPIKRGDVDEWKVRWAALTQRGSYAPLPIVEARLGGLGANDRAASQTPALKYNGQTFPGGQSFPRSSNVSIADRWKGRLGYVRQMVVTRRRAAKRAASTSGGRRLKSDVLWSLNCSGHWRGGEAAKPIDRRTLFPLPRS